MEVKTWQEQTAELKEFIEQMEQRLFDATAIRLKFTEEAHPAVIDVECEEVGED